MDNLADAESLADIEKEEEEAQQAEDEAEEKEKSPTLPAAKDDDTDAQEADTARANDDGDHIDGAKDETGREGVDDGMKHSRSRSAQKQVAFWVQVSQAFNRMHFVTIHSN